MNKIIYLFLVFFTLGFSSCSSVRAPKTAAQLYDFAIQNYEKGFYSQAIQSFQKVISQNPGTKYATFSYFKMGDSQFEMGSSKYSEAEINYRIFLSLNPKSHLVPSVLNKLIELSFKRNEHWFFGTYYDFTRNPESFKKIITEYQRFYLLYPDSLYLKDSKQYMLQSIQILASHEFMIGNWYFEQSLYPSSIARYQYLLKQYPYFINSNEVVLKLIEAYKKNQQAHLAEELLKVYNFKYKNG